MPSFQTMPVAGTPARVKPEGRLCLLCGAKLSKHNLDDYCHSHPRKLVFEHRQQSGFVPKKDEDPSQRNFPQHGSSSGKAPVPELDNATQKKVDEYFELVAEELGVSRDLICGTTSAQEVVAARRALSYLLSADMGFAPKAVAGLMEKTPAFGDLSVRKAAEAMRSGDPIIVAVVTNVRRRCLAHAGGPD